MKSADCYATLYSFCSRSNGYYWFMSLSLCITLFGCISVVTAADGTLQTSRTTQMDIYYLYTTFGFTNDAAGVLPAKNIMLDLLNNFSNLLPRFKIVIHMIDTKYDTTQSVSTSLNAYYTEMILSKDKTIKPVPLVFGPDWSKEAAQLVNIAGHYHQVFLANQIQTPLLSDRSQYPYFARTMNHGGQYITPAIKLMEQYGVKRLSIIHDQDTYAADPALLLLDQVAAAGMQVIFRSPVNLDANSPLSHADQQEVAARIVSTDSRVVLLYMDVSAAANFTCAFLTHPAVQSAPAGKYVFFWLCVTDASMLPAYTSQEDYSKANPDHKPWQYTASGTNAYGPQCSQDLFTNVLKGSFEFIYTVWVYDDSLKFPWITDSMPSDIRAKYNTSTHLFDSIKYLQNNDPQYGPKHDVAPQYFISNCIDQLWAGFMALDAAEKILSMRTTSPRSITEYQIKYDDSPDVDPPDAIVNTNRIIGKTLYDALVELQFQGATGNFSFLPADTKGNNKGDRGGVLTLQQFQTHSPGAFKPIGTYDLKEKAYTFTATPVFYSSSGVIDDGSPGFWDDPLNLGMVIAVIVLASLGLVACVGFILMRRLQLGADMKNPPWKIPSDELRSMTGNPTGQSQVMSTMDSAMEQSAISGSVVKLHFVEYRGQMVQLVQLPEGAHAIAVTRKNHELLKTIRDFSQANLQKFMGVSNFNGAECLVWECCQKGTLRRLILSKWAGFDQHFKINVILDILKGLKFLHTSVVGVHGQLRSSTCRVDQRFTVKLGDYGEHKIAPMLGLRHVKHTEELCEPGNLIYLAPEMLRDVEIPPAQGTVAGDMYAFAIVSQEILSRTLPFQTLETRQQYGDKNAELDDEKVISLVKHGGSNPCRPIIPDEVADSRVLQLIQRCWAEDPTERPNAGDVGKQMKVVSGVGNANFTDQLIQRLEKYASDMEGLVGERTQELEREKKKSEELLHQILPPSIANELKKKGQVLPQSFQEVTIYFSDIVGFTVISGSSEPLQVVAMLNHLYTVFDGTIDRFDVYKVETIGDAYMCVSGLPHPNGNRHSREIALMSLALLHQADKFVIPHRPGENLKLRIGLHSGPCVAGVVGLKMPRYCLFGDTVNTASRMESNGEALKIHISNVCKLKLDEHNMFQYESRGELDIKGKGKMLTFWLTGTTDPSALNMAANPPGRPSDVPNKSASVRFSDNAKQTDADNGPTKTIIGATKSFFSVASFGGAGFDDDETQPQRAASAKKTWQ